MDIYNRLPVYSKKAFIIKYLFKLGQRFFNYILIVVFINGKVDPCPVNDQEDFLCPYWDEDIASSTDYERSFGPCCFDRSLHTIEFKFIKCSNP